MERREFFLAISIFTVMAVVGVGFSLFYVSRFAPVQAPVVGNTDKGSPNADLTPRSIDQAATTPPGGKITRQPGSDDAAEQGAGARQGAGSPQGGGAAP